MQIGRGAFIGNIGTRFTQGSMEITNNPTDVGIAGEGFFVLRNDSEEFYTRDGSFQIDASGRLVDPSTGYTVQGRMATETGEIASSAPITNIVLPIESLFPPRATANITFSGNLDADAGIADAGADGIEDVSKAYQASVLVYDSLGDTHTITITFGLTDTTNQWAWEAGISTGDPNIISGTASGLIHFNSDGSINDGTGTDPVDAVLAAEMTANIVISGVAGAGKRLL